jgi:cell division protease FtsH
MSESIHAEATLREIDLEVKRLVDEGYKTAVDALTSQRTTLDRLSADLMEMETMTAEHMHKVIDENRKGPKLMSVPPLVAETRSTMEGKGAADEAGGHEPLAAAE